MKVSFEGMPDFPISMRRIMADVCRDHMVTPKQLCATSQSKILVAARKAYCRRVRNELGYSYPRIGRSINRDHSTVMYYVKKSGDVK